MTKITAPYLLDDGTKESSIKTCTCGFHLTTKNAPFVGEQDLSVLPEYEGKSMLFYNCPKCDSTAAHIIDKPSESLNKSKLTLDHYSAAPSLSNIDPKYHGKGVKGEESKRKANPDWVDRSYHYLAGTTPESTVGALPYKYQSQIDEDKIYDFVKDPGGLKAKSMWGSTVDKNLYEKNIKEAGYHGYINRGAPGMGSVVALFHPIQTTPGTLKKSNSFNKIRTIAQSYNQKNGLPDIQHDSSLPDIDKDLAKKLSDAFGEMSHSPSHPDVKKSYNALKNETLNQYNHLVDHGYKFTPMELGQENPYKNSKEMISDVHENKHLYYFPTEQGFGPGGESDDHPLLEHVTTKDGKKVPANDLLRTVHDVMGHAKEGFSFGPKGEEAAWREHMKMYSPDAQKALTTELRLQNHYVNWGPNGEHNRSNPSQTIYGQQKAGLPPDWAMIQNHPKKATK